MKRVIAVLFAVGLMAVGGEAPALNIAFFDNAAYTDPPDESTNLAASLTALGHTLNSFSGITAADWTANTAANDLLVIPELDSGDLVSALDAAAQTAIASYIAGGGGLIMFDRTFSAPRTINFLNTIFGYSLVASAGFAGVSFLNAAEAAGTVFAGGPASLPGANATEGVQTASLPAGALSLYEDGADTTVFAVYEGLGPIVFLGFDWFELPTPADWETVLGSAVLHAATPIPEPSAVALFAVGALVVSASLRRDGRRRRSIQSRELP